MAAPANDNFADSEVIAGASGTVAGTNVDATLEVNEPVNPEDGGGSSVWYNWTAPASGTFIIHTDGSDFDTIMAVYTGTALTNLVLVDAGDLNDARIEFTAVNGTTYHISVDGWNNNTGDVVLNWGLFQTPDNDDFANSETIAGSSGTTTGHNILATLEVNEPVNPEDDGGHSIWYTWTAPATEIAIVDTNGSDFDTIMAIYTGTALTNLVLVASDDSDGDGSQSLIEFEIVNGTTYHISIDGDNDNVGTVVLNWQLKIPAVNDDFADSEEVFGNSGTVNGANWFATLEVDEPENPVNDGGASIWYNWTPSSSGDTVISTDGSGFDTIMALYTGTALNNLVLIDADDDGGEGSRSLIEFTAVAGTTYHISVDGYSGREGTVVFNWLLDTALAVVPDIVGLTQSAAETALTDNDLVVGEASGAFSEDIDVDIVLTQDPIEGIELAKGSSVDYVFSLGFQPTFPEHRPLDYDADLVWDEETKTWYSIDTAIGAERMPQSGGRYRNQLVCLSEQGKIYFGSF